MMSIVTYSFYNLFYDIPAKQFNSIQFSSVQDNTVLKVIEPRLGVYRAVVREKNCAECVRLHEIHPAAISLRFEEGAPLIAL